MHWFVYGCVRVGQFCNTQVHIQRRSCSFFLRNQLFHFTHPTPPHPPRAPVSLLPTFELKECLKVETIVAFRHAEIYGAEGRGFGGFRAAIRLLLLVVLPRCEIGPGGKPQHPDIVASWLALVAATVSAGTPPSPHGQGIAELYRLPPPS